MNEGEGCILMSTKKIKFRLPDEIVLPIMLIAPRRVMSDKNARLASGEVNRLPRIVYSTVTLDTKGMEVEVDTDVQHADKVMTLIGFCDPNGRWQYFDAKDGGQTTWHSVIAEYLARFGDKEKTPDPALPDTDAFLDQLTEDTDDQVVAELSLQRRRGPVTQKHFVEQLAQSALEIAEGNAGSARMEITARGTAHVINPGDRR